MQITREHRRLSRSVRIAKSEPLCSLTLGSNPRPAHARFGLTNPNPFALSRSVRIDKSEPLCSLTLGSD
ncbi:hypothetical protein QUF72_09520 [Desulfobacterales bacterium HSG2]|nr:hypothetical protein [Desulfobacterales bacterium HSG2]